MSGDRCQCHDFYEGDGGSNGLFTEKGSREGPEGVGGRYDLKR